MNSEETNPHTQYEPAQTKGWCLGLTAAFLVFTLLIIFIFVGQMLAYFNRTAPGQSTRVAVPPAPRLQSAPEQDWRALRDEQTRRLNSYGWADKARGTVHIPIERAMDEMAEEAKNTPQVRTSHSGH